jgi:NADP-dependent 3-hydroxy acid dehydrogenase YdfG
MPVDNRKVALVTGCSEPDSLGAALALNLLSRGYKVYATARKLESMKQLEGKGCEVSGSHQPDYCTVLNRSDSYR